MTSPRFDGQATATGDRYLALLKRVLFPIVEVVHRLGISQPGEWTANFVEARLLWPVSIDELMENEPDRKLTHGELWRELKAARDLKHAPGPKPH